MPMVARAGLARLLEAKSPVRVGPRRTGKTSLIRQTLSGVRTPRGDLRARASDLLDSSVYLSLSRDPGAGSA
jgi:predicted AAA+ superfamily ATPase